MDTLKFIFLCGSPLVLFISLLLLCMFWKREIVRLTGLYSVLGGLNVVVLMLIFPVGNFDQTLIISATVDLIFIIPIIYLFRDLYKLGIVIPWGLLIFEIFRFAKLILYSLSSRPKLTNFEAYLFYFYYFVPFVILLYCILARNKSGEMRQTVI